MKGDVPMTITEQAAYLKGLAEGMNLDAAKPESKLILRMLDLISDIADKLEAVDDELETHDAYLDELDHDLGELEEEVYDCLNELDEEDCCCDDDCCCGGDCCDDEEPEYDFDEFFNEDEVFYESVCPICDEKVYFDDTVDSTAITCPACGAIFDCESDKVITKDEQ